MLTEHTKAVRDIVTSIPILTNKVHDALRTSEGDTLVQENYVVLTPTIPARRRERWNIRQQAASAARYRYDARIVAVDPDGCNLLADAVQLTIGRTPIVEGRTCEPLALAEAVEEGGMQFDREAGLYFLDLTLEFVSRPKN